MKIMENAKLSHLCTHTAVTESKSQSERTSTHHFLPPSLLSSFPPHTHRRNNGFLNMLAMLKRKAVEAEAKGEGAGQEEPEVDFEEDITRPVYSSTMKKLINFLKPKKLILNDDSAQHAGHAGAKGLKGESHFSLKIVADCFDGLSLVQRHKLIYTVLTAEMQQIHALSIDAKTPAEVGL